MVTRNQLQFSIRGILALLSILVMSFYIELLGWRITRAEITYTEAWSYSYISGALLTFAGASLLGLCALAVGMMLPVTRERVRKHLMFVWGGGAAIFLLAMLGLVMWAPELQP